MERSRQLATMAAAAIVGAALVILWPRAELPPPKPSDPVQTSGAPSQAEQVEPPTTPSVPPARIEPPAADEPADPELVRTHALRARATLERLAAQAAQADDAPTRALGPRLIELAELAPEGSGDPQLQSTAALILGELAIRDQLAASSLDAAALIQELDALAAGWIGPTPDARPATPEL